MDIRELTKPNRCPGAVLLKKVFIQNYMIGFTRFSKNRQCGVADVISSTGDIVWGLLYSLPENELPNLDRAEGHPNAYRRIEIDVETINGETIKAQTYEVVNKSPELVKPSKEYIGFIISAAKKHEFPDAYLSVLKDVPTL